MARVMLHAAGVRHVVGTWVVICVAACAGDPRPSVEVQGAPLLVAEEGAERRARVTLDPPPDAPLDPARFAVEPLGALVFERLAVEADATGAPELVIVAACSQVLGRGDILVPLRVSDTTGAATPRDVMLVVESGDQGACAPTVDIWLRESSSCDEETPPAPRLSAIPIVPIEEPQALCVAVTPRDPSVTTAVKIDSTAPRRLVGDLPLEAPLAGPVRFELPIGDSRYFRGEFEIAWEVLRTAGPPLTGVVKLLVGDPGDLAISVHRDTVDVAEFAVAQSAFRTWVYDANEEPPCVTAVATAGDVAVYTAAGVRVAGWGCGTDQFFFRYAPPIDAAPEEVVYLVACRCADDPSACDARCLPIPADPMVCDGAIEVGAAMACIDVPHAVANVADDGAGEPLACAGGVVATTLEPGLVAAIDFNGRLIGQFTDGMRELTGAGWVALPMPMTDLSLAATVDADFLAVVDGGDLVLRCPDGCPDTFVAAAPGATAVASTAAGLVVLTEPGAMATSEAWAVAGAGVLHFFDGQPDVAALGPIRALAAHDGRLFVASAAGVHERLADGAWTPRDPLQRRDALAGVITPPGATFGTRLVACTDHLAYTLETGAHRFTRTDAVVALP